MKFAHIADTHIKNLKYHYEYRIVFEKLYEKLREEKVDYIIHCGDLAHTKTQISPEFVEMCTNFLRSLADIAPTYVILGNHDGNLKNSSRQDALTPIVDALEHTDLHLLKNSGEVCLNDEFTINVLSVFDRDNWANISDTNRINIALYHGSISNSKTDLGWIMEHGEDDASIFEGYDFAFLGDIHKTNQVLDYKGTIRYAGSTVQQNHGETNDKGFLIWDIENKNDFTCKHVTIENPKPFITIELTPKGRIPNKIKVPSGARVRLVSNNNLPLDIMKKAVEIAKHRFKPESITFLNRAAGERGNIDEFADGLATDNLRDPVVQEELIEEYLKDFQPEDDLLQRVIKLNSKYNRVAEDQEEIGRNVNWKLESLDWENLFNYGDRNRISFSKLNGIVGIFGKNFSGKSSIIDSMLYTLFNSTSKNERKNLNIINQNKKCGTGKVEISIGNKRYTVQRTSEKYVKKLKGEETLEAKTDLNFECYDEATDETQSLNGLTRNDTDKNIRKHFGTLEDFLLTSMSSQLGSLQFISEGSTRRKEILAKFLDLEMFEKKYKMAKEDASDLRGALKRLEGKEFDEDITDTTREVALNENLTEQHIKKCDTIKEELSRLKESSDQLNDKINSISAEVINIVEVERDLSGKQTESIELIAQNIELNGNVNDGMEKLNKINTFVNDFNIKELEDQQENVQEKRQELEQILSEISTEEIKLQNQEKKAELLKEVPCGSEYSHCKFIRDAYVAVDKLSLTRKNCDSLEDSSKKINDEISELNPEKIESHLEKYKQVQNRKIQLEAELKTNSALAAKNEIEYKAVQKELEDLDASRAEYYENREAILGKESLMRDLKKHQSNTTKKEKELEDCQQKLLDLYKEHGSVEQKLISLIEQQQELLDLREDFSAYDLFMRCMHSNGISYDIIKRKLPVINNEIAKVLANVVDFEVFFENDGRHLKILIKHPKHEPRPIEMGSGAEKTIAAMAIRLALLSVSNLPKSNIFILDEPGTSLDADNMDGFVRILDLVKSYFKTVFLISHLDSLKDCVDMQITIDKKGQYAYVMET
jgi:DNA repair exonuclease SbcCD ATPase subunit/DNA repair exonuclease SbcCD nuclease subunit